MRLNYNNNTLTEQCFNNLCNVDYSNNTYGKLKSSVDLDVQGIQVYNTLLLLALKENRMIAFLKQRLDLQKGQLISTTERLARKARLSMETTENYLNIIEKNGLISIFKEKHYLLISIKESDNKSFS